MANNEDLFGGSASSSKAGKGVGAAAAKPAKSAGPVEYNADSIEVLRRYTLQLPPNAKGWFAAVNDPLLSRALQVVHGEPARRWTVDDIAREAGSSRTVVAERFNAVLGQSPIEYVTHWRMQIAAERLRSSRESLAEIAAGVGYESEAAFNRAFKRVTGETPGRWRDSASALI